MSAARLLLRALLVLALTLTACHRQAEAPDPNVDYYTCTMHPSVHSHDPHAKCPICSMDLEPVMKKSADPLTTETPEAAPVFHEFTVPVQRQQQIGVTYAVAEKRPLQRSIRTVGIVAPDKTRRWEYVARVDGYVQKLLVSSPGESVEEGQPLLTIYSPELATAERELINLLEARDHTQGGAAGGSIDRSLEAARHRLEQWNITPTQIAELEKSRHASENLTLVSPFRGVVEELPVEQGRKLMSGNPLVVVADLSAVWVWADFYEDNLPLLTRGAKVRVSSPAQPGESHDGEVALIPPAIDPIKRTARVRIDLPNASLKLRPGMYVDAELAVDRGEALAIPVSAVMPTGTRALVFVDRGEGRLEPRPVQLGRLYGDHYEVLGGIAAGERVVASANFLIDAEAKVQGAVQAFQEPVPAK